MFDASNQPDNLTHMKIPVPFFEVQLPHSSYKGSLTGAQVVSKQKAGI
jgi:hypothetical protein